MKTGWLVYRPEETARNRAFIDRWMAAAQAQGARLSLVTADRLRWGIRNGAAFAAAQDGAPWPDFCVMRLNDPVLTETLERAGIPCFNDSRTARICNDKRLTHLLFQGRVPMMDTVFAQPGVPCPFPFPAVVKAAHSAGGRHVFWCADEQAYQAALAQCLPDAALAQPACDTPGRDVRVYVVGNRIVQTMMRFSTDGDFRSNLGQGGDAVPFKLPGEARSYVDTVLSEFSFGLAGIDFIFHRGQLLLNEIEDAVGTRMLYIHTDVDAAALYLAHILSVLVTKL